MNIYDPAYIRGVLRPLGFNFSKARGQNFLIDKDVPLRMAACLPGMTQGKSAGVLEIGPGFGALTHTLLPVADKLTAIEVDRRLADVLSERYGTRENFTLLREDALRTDMNGLADRYFKGLTPVAAGNLPYSITTDLLRALLKADRYRAMILMVQREVARRLDAAPGTAEYGAFTLFVRVYCTCEHVFDVPPEAFMPRPGVVSSVILLMRRETPLVPEEKRKLFFQLSRAAFAQRRKTLVNALGAVMPGMSKGETESRIRAAGIDPGVRGETLGIEDYLRLCDAYL